MVIRLESYVRISFQGSRATPRQSSSPWQALRKHRERRSPSFGASQAGEGGKLYGASSSGG